jgi:sporulation protein YlmC with PRC-barrel domain
MSEPNQVNLGLRLLDDQLIDREGNRCGRVDDVEFTGAPGEETEINALLTGSASWPSRLPWPLSSLLDEMASGFSDCIPWSAVEQVSTCVQLSLGKEDLGLDTDDGRNVRWKNEPGTDRIQLTDLLGSKVVDSDGRSLGKVREVRAERVTPAPSEQVNEAWRISGLLLGLQGLRERIGMTTRERLEGEPWFVPWDRVMKVEMGTITTSGGAGRASS